MTRRVLLIAYHFPPLAGSSGIQRTLGFARHLQKYGWEPIILTAHPRAYPGIDENADWNLPRGLIVERAQAFDAARHLSLFGRYPQRFALPDRWASWRFDGTYRGMKLIRRLQPQAIWSTYPIATAHLIGAALARRSGLPWIADFRDPMAHEGYPSDARTWQSYKQVEEQIFTRARIASFTTPGALRLYRERYALSDERLALIENGFDEESFNGITSAPLDSNGDLILLHSGIVYPEWRNPLTLFQALRRLIDAGCPGIERLKLRFRAAVHDDFIMQCASKYDVMDRIQLLPAISYRDALREMMSAHALLVLQSNGCNDQIPAKSYEYLRAARPLLVLADPAGNTGALFIQTAGAHVAALENAEAVAVALKALVANLQQENPVAPDAALASRYTRQAQAEQLAQLLDRVTLRRT
ncbi:MAG TPA: glycosyltransferase [Rhodocyclaceae bacterium]|nr:glycosyltransferase [Rhodocyclaceae bacterium]